MTIVVNKKLWNGIIEMKVYELNTQNDAIRLVYNGSPDDVPAQLILGLMSLGYPPEGELPETWCS